jgi:glycosyltransferase involved in cell wall biosynthesis
MPSPKRIVYVINALAAGGTERQLLYLLGGLERSLYTPHLITLYSDDQVPYFYKSELAALGIPISTLAHGAGVLGRIRALLRYVRLIWQLRPHLVQGCLHYANLIARVCRPLCPPHALLSSARGMYLPNELRSEARTFWLDDGLIVNSPEIAHDVVTHTKRPPSRIHFIANGLPFERFAHNTMPSLRADLFPSARFVIGLIGRITWLKDHATLLAALQLARHDMPEGLAVYFLGEVGEPDVEKRLKDSIAHDQLGDVVRLLPATHDVSPYFHCADMIVLPSLSEGFPNVILEAFAAGKPVIVSEAADRIGLVKPGLTGWRFKTQDALALAQCLREAWSAPPDLLAQMGSTARSIAAAYGVGPMVQQYVNLYKHMIEQP